VRYGRRDLDMQEIMEMIMGIIGNRDDRPEGRTDEASLNSNSSHAARHQRPLSFYHLYPTTLKYTLPHAIVSLSLIDNISQIAS
jgi:hypothetical protein